ncbi:MAG: universal stress protein [Gammaproteobacteria bacterium]
MARGLLAATDLQPKTEFAVERAGMLADQLGRSWSLVHVLSYGSAARQLEQRIDRARLHLRSRALSPTSRFQTVPEVVIRLGSAPEAIARTAQELEAVLVILGPHRTRGMPDSLIGTTLARLLRHRQCPVLLVRREPRNAYRNVLLALDLSNAAIHTVRAAEALVPLEDAAVSIVHAFEPPYKGMLKRVGVRDDTVAAFATAWQRRERRQLNQLLARAGVDQGRYEVEIDDASPLSAIGRAMERREPDLLIVGTRAHGVLQSMISTSVAARAVAATDCDVLIVPRRRELAARHFAGPSAAETRAAYG